MQLPLHSLVLFFTFLLQHLPLHSVYIYIYIYIYIYPFYSAMHIVRTDYSDRTSVTMFSEGFFFANLLLGNIMIDRAHNKAQFHGNDQLPAVWMDGCIHLCSRSQLTDDRSRRGTPGRTNNIACSINKNAKRLLKFVTLPLSITSH